LHDMIHHHYPDGRLFPREECVLEQVHATGQSVRNKEDVFFRKGGSPVRVECSNASMEVKDRRVGAILMVRDITERKAQEEIRRRCEDLEQQNRRMQEANRLKSEFLANMSHELRTPLNAVIGFSEVLVDERAGPLNDTQHDFLTDIWTSANHLLQLVNDILDLAKVEAGKMELNLETFSIEAAIAETVATINAIAAKKNIPVIVEAPPPEIVATLDPLRFKQILYNLLSNAVKFTPDNGTVTVTASRDGDERIRLRVKDTGIGIKQEDLSRLFHEFEQLDAGLARRQEGTGLGLALTKKIVELQSGSITVESEFGYGSMFTVVLPTVSGKD